MRRSPLVVTGLAGLLLAAAPRPARAADDLDVITTSGPIRGVLAPDETAPVMKQWRGIPYAQKPLVELRWKPPVPPDPWTEVLDASEFKSACPQPSWDEDVYWGDEDCLYLNVSAPLDTTAASRKAVFVHVHPGANWAGRAYENPAQYVARDVIVVTFDYRVGVLGMLAHPALSEEGGGTSANYTLWDQLAVLQWVQDNIAAFGGDPDQVTLGGFSAGAGDVLALAASPVARGLFARVANQAMGVIDVNGQRQSLAEREQVGVWFAGQLGCDAAPDVLDCLRHKPLEEVVPWYGGWDLVPVVDGVILPAAPIDQIAANGGTVPMLIGSDREEHGYAIFDDFLPEPLRWSGFVAFTKDLLGAAISAEVRPLYTEEIYGTLRRAFVALHTDVLTTCPTGLVADATSNVTYRYLYTRPLAENPDSPLVGAVHGMEDALLWTGGEADVPLTEAERTLSSQMIRYWTNFMKTGDPNPTPREADLPEWPRYDPVAGGYMQLDVGAVSDDFGNHDMGAQPGKYHEAECEVINRSILYPDCLDLCRYWMQGVDRVRGVDVKFGVFGF